MTASFASCGIFSIQIAQTLYFGVLAMGSRASIVKALVSDSGKWKGMKIVPCSILSETLILTSMLPLIELALTLFPSRIPNSIEII
jgi:hypothetical protein